MNSSFVALGSNVGDSRQHLLDALRSLAALNSTTLVACSRLYRSEPMGPKQPDYLNAVVKIDTTLEPLALLDELQRIEHQQGRVRLERWGPRTLDLDILLYDNLLLNSDRLVIPHPGLHLRNFVLLPLTDIDPQLVLPTGTSLQELLGQCDRSGICAVADRGDWYL